MELNAHSAGSKHMIRYGSETWTSATWIAKTLIKLKNGLIKTWISKTSVDKTGFIHRSMFY